MRGSGYITAPRVYLTGGGGTGAMAAAMLNGAMVMNGKNLVEGFDMEFGRMNAVLGSTPNPLAPTVGAGPVIGAAFYIDPPTEILKSGETVLWRLTHIGVDSHAIHFHLFNVQVVNRVDWTNTIKPPYETSWAGRKPSGRTRSKTSLWRYARSTMTLPFQIPNSNRLLDPTMPAGSTANFLPVAPPIGLPAVAQTTNVMTNFGWEYVWHCHLLGHEENDMMRPIAFLAKPIFPVTAGVYHTANRTFTLQASPANLVFTFGATGDKPIVGDWNGDGITTIGVYRPSTSQFMLRNSNNAGAANVTFTFTGGVATDIPIAGDWTGKGYASVGLYRPSTRQFMLKNLNTTGPANTVFTYGSAGDSPVVGDWNGDGTTTIGVYRPTTRTFFLRNSNTAGAADIAAFTFGIANDKPVVGDWNGDGSVTAGVFRSSGTPTFFERNTNNAGPADVTVPFGASGDTPFSGTWK